VPPSRLRIVGSIRVTEVDPPPARDSIVVVFTGTVLDTSLAYSATGMLVMAEEPVFLIVLTFTELGSRAKTALEGTVFTIPEIVRSFVAAAFTVIYPAFTSESLPPALVTVRLTV